MSASVPTVPPSKLRYIPALDGMRGLSLPGTILTHYALFLEFQASAPHWLSSVGPLTLNIQMFFVLSGALITSLLVSEHQRTGTVSLRNFYLRRSRRLGPALLAAVVVIGLVEVFWPGSRSSSPLGSHPWLALGAVSAFVGNWVLFRISGGIGWLGPAWTLGIEEQFYLTWPILLVTALRRRMRRGALYLSFAVVLAAALITAAVLQSHVGKWRAFYATPVQLPSILFGCVLGYELTANPTGRLARLVRSRAVALTGLGGMVATSIFLVHHPAPLYKGGYAVYATFACMLIGHCFVRAADPTVITRVLGWKPFVVVGQISYEAYLIHVVVIIGMARAFPTVHVYPMMAIDTIVVALVSAAFYYSVEQPIRRRGWRSAFTGHSFAPWFAPARQIALVGGLAGVTALVGVGVIAARTATPVQQPVVAASASLARHQAGGAVGLRLGAGRVTAMVPAVGPAVGGATLTIRGRHFTRDTQVFFDSVPARHVTRVNSTTLRVVTPPAPRAAHHTAAARLHRRQVTVSVRDTRGAGIAGRYTYH